MYKRRRGWWDEYGLHIQKSPTRDKWIVGISGFGKSSGGLVWEFDSFEDAENAVEEFVLTFWEGHGEDFAEFGYGGGMPTENLTSLRQVLGNSD